MEINKTRKNFQRKFFVSQKSEISVISTREAYGKKLAEIGADERVVVLDADLSQSTKTNIFAKKYPERFFNMGVSEQDMIGTAAGLATCNKIVFANSFGVFTSGRAFDQIRVTVAYPKLKVVLVGSHCGLLTGEDGASHQATEDVALMRVLPNMTVVQPCDGIETEKAIEGILKYNGPVYLRLGRIELPIINNENYKFELGKGVLLKDGKNLTIIATGAVVNEALKASEELQKENISVRIINIHTIKPIDKEIIIKAAKETKLIITAEDHNIIGGLGSAVAEVLSENWPCRIVRIGLKDTFGESGSPKELYKKYGLDSEGIINTIKNNL